jgi:spore germination protein GerM
VAAKGKKSSGFGWILFWVAFIIGVALLFAVNWPKIQETLRETRALERLFNNGEELPAGEGETAAEPESGGAPSGTEDESGAAESSDPALPPEAPVPVEGGGTAAAGGPAEETVSRTVYLIRVDNDGAVLPARVQRTLPKSASPLRDALEAAIRGPLGDEEKKGLMSLIPPEARILSAAVQGSTAYVSFSEDFLFNTYGIEGYAAQLRQVVWTATEFSNVKDVQILIDGKRLDYLGEGIWIGSPLNRTAP